ncbi:NAD-dependent epimerase/dehydratase family protein [Actinotalea sp. K2]|uniref:NAD-dependent epimerase/dehydratase family protein n=1 Tax=Actinotalea sp. K2 TaxID=2939438 RepID=UPI0020171736|nr:NAD-dependent epimerase/dehydratase family protein [Actinotalea sp. K2]MCL3862921.1 NAD-dependent epimerase/dehydratase family protein [Actinotalea sp. K2]
MILFAVASAAAALGWAEDVKGIPVRFRAVTQLLIALAGAAALATVSDLPWWAVPAAGLAVAAYVNVANFMDGLDGISGLHGLVVGAALATVGGLMGLPWLVLGGVVLAMSFLGFLPWNLGRRAVFLGDVGSYLLGATIAILCLAAFAEGVPAITVLGPVAIYLADTGVTLLRRVVNGERWFEAHRSHCYQRLTDRGLTHVQTSAIVAGATALTSALGLLALPGAPGGTAVSTIAIAAVAAVYLALPRLLSSDAEPLDPMPEGRISAATSPSTAPRWAVIGASGFIGGALVAELRTHGFEVVEVAAPRLELDPTATPRETALRARHCTVTIQSLVEDLQGAEVVVNAAGIAAPDGPSGAALSGANSLLPAVAAAASALAGARRFVHLSSAAVQGRRGVLDESSETSPFSPYSRSKAVGEAALLLDAWRPSPDGTGVVVVRATSVQGPGRPTTVQLQRVARSRFASTARPGDRPTVVSSLDGLVEFVRHVGSHPGAVPSIVLQPWEGLTTADVLEAAGGRRPLLLPASACRAFVSIGYLAGRVVPGLNGLVRRVEVMWLGQRQEASWARSVSLDGRSYVRETLRPRAEGGR